jgi:hypothetical protein
MKLLKPTIALFIFCFGSSCIYGCLTPGSLIGGFDRDTYVFIGKVKGYTNATKPKQSNTPEIFGLELDLVQKVYVPRNSKSYRLYPLRMMSDCTEGGLGSGEIKSRFPIDSLVRVIARKSEFVIEPSSDLVVLEAGYVDHTSVSAISSEDSRLSTELKSIFDYETLASHSSIPLSDRYYFVSFEIQKDLFRLETAKSTAKVEAILVRLEKAPEYARIDISEIRREYIMRNRN